MAGYRNLMGKVGAPPFATPFYATQTVRITEFAIPGGPFLPLRGFHSSGVATGWPKRK